MARPTESCEMPATSAGAQTPEKQTLSPPTSQKTTQEVRSRLLKMIMDNEQTRRRNDMSPVVRS